MIDVRKTTVYRGPNIWARMPVIQMIVDIAFHSPLLKFKILNHKQETL